MKEETVKQARLENFLENANRRLGKAVGAMRTIARMNTTNFEYTNEHIAKIKTVLESEVKKTIDALENKRRTNQRVKENFL